MKILVYITLLFFSLGYCYSNDRHIDVYPGSVWSNNTIVNSDYFVQLTNTFGFEGLIIRDKNSGIILKHILSKYNNEFTSYAVTKNYYYILKEENEIFQGKIKSNEMERRLEVSAIQTGKINQIYCYDDNHIVIATDENETYLYNVNNNSIEFLFSYKSGKLIQSTIDKFSYRDISGQFYNIKNIDDIITVRYMNPVSENFCFFNNHLILDNGSLVSLNLDDNSTYKINTVYPYKLLTLNYHSENLILLFRRNNVSKLTFSDEKFNFLDSVSLNEVIYDIKLIDDSKFIYDKSNLGFFDFVYNFKNKNSERYSFHYNYNLSPGSYTLSKDGKFVYINDKDRSVLNLKSRELTFFSSNTSWLDRGNDFKKIHFDDYYGFIYQANNNQIYYLDNYYSNEPIEKLLFSSSNDINFLYFSELKIYFEKNQSLYVYDLNNKVERLLMDDIDIDYIYHIDNNSVVYCKFLNQDRYAYEVNQYFFETYKTLNLAMYFRDRQPLNESCYYPINNVVVKGDKILIANVTIVAPFDKYRGLIEIFNLYSGKKLFEIPLENEINGIAAKNQNSFFVIQECSEITELVINYENKSYSQEKLDYDFVYWVHHNDGTIERKDGIHSIEFKDSKLLIGSRFANNIFLVDFTINSIEITKEDAIKLVDYLSSFDKLKIFNYEGSLLFESKEQNSASQFLENYKIPLFIQIEKDNKFYYFKIINF